MSDDNVSYASVVFSEEGVAEFDQHRRASFVPKSDVLSLEIRHTSGLERPLIAIVVGALITIASLYPLVPLLDWFQQGGTLQVDLLPLLAFSLLGLWMIWFAVRKRQVLVVHTPKGRRKLIFHGTVDSDAARGALAEAVQRYGYISNTATPDASPTYVGSDA